MNSLKKIFKTVTVAQTFAPIQWEYSGYKVFVRIYT